MYRFFDLTIRTANSGCTVQIQFHATNVAFVRDDFGMNFENNRAADFLRKIDSFLFASRDSRFDDVEFRKR